MVRFSWKIHFLTIFFCSIIVVLSLSIGVIIEDKRISNFQEGFSEQNIFFKEFEVYSSLEEIFGISFENNCSIANSVFQNLNTELINSLKLVESFGNNIQTDDFKNIYSLYVLDNLNFWLFFERFGAPCEVDKASILYFYSFDDCPSCKDQSNVLTKLRINSEKTLLVFPLNLDFVGDEPFVSTLVDHFNISELPSVVIGREVYSGFKSENEIRDVICSSNGESVLSFCN